MESQEIPKPWWKSPEVILASGLGSGFIPGAPGTWGSLASLPVWLALHVWVNQIWFDIFLPIALFLLGLHSTKKALVLLHSQSLSLEVPEHKRSDPSFVVIDEWVGQWVALIGVSSGNWLEIGLAFFLFRIFDVVKLGPVKRAEQLPGALGIMADDVLAGVIACLVLAMARSLLLA